MVHLTSLGPTYYSEQLSLLRKVRRWRRWRDVCRCRRREARCSSQLPDAVGHGDGRRTRRGGGRERAGRGGSQRHGRRTAGCRTASRRAACRRAACRRAACEERLEEATPLDARAFAPGEREACMVKRSGVSQPWDGSFSAPPQLSASLSSASIPQGFSSPAEWMISGLSRVGCCELGQFDHAARRLRARVKPTYARRRSSSMCSSAALLWGSMPRGTSVRFG
eukprot:scaffold41313_cov87-Phaeocystis_antarctica.AAC.2